VADAIAAMSSEWWTDIITPWSDAANMTALEAELTTRFGPMVAREAYAYVALSATNAGAITWGNARNSPYVFPIAAYRLPTPPDEWAAVVGILAARDFANDPARPMTGVALPGILPPAVADRFDDTEMNLLLFEGISDWTVDADGTVRLSRLVTSYQTNAYGAADDAWLDATTPHTVRRVRHTLTNYVEANHARQKIADDGTRFGAGQNVATPSAIKGTIAAAYMALEAAGLIEDVKAALANTLVERDANDPTRVNVLTPPNLVNPLYVIAIKLQFSL
jgi:phage tail sheath gpL-like